MCDRSAPLRPRPAPGIRVNAVAPGPVHTPLVASTFSPEMLASVKSQTKMGRMAMPAEIAPTYVLLASEVCVYVREGAAGGWQSRLPPRARGA